MMGAGKEFLRAVVLGGIACWLIGCGGGGGGSSSSSGSSSSALTITTTTLPGTLQGHAYTATLTATGGQGALHWAISPISPTTPFATGLSIDSSTGVLSGTANFQGTGAFTAQVTDSSPTPQTATKVLLVTAAAPLKGGTSQGYTLAQYQSATVIVPTAQGGVAPISYSVAGGCLPPGIRLNANGQVSGAALATGTFVCTIGIQDSFTPPEVASEQLTLTVNVPTLTVMNAPLGSVGILRMLVGRPFSGKVYVGGGTPPYTILVSSGPLPPGIGPIDPSSGQFSGTPTQAGAYGFNVIVTDSASPPATTFGDFGVTVAQPVGRNDTPATATPLPGNGSYSASISPYIDPPNGTPVPGDSDYYKLVSLGGSTVHVETQAKRLNPNNPLDTVLEIVDGNEVQLTTCRQPGDTGTNFTSACINDDISASPHVQDSALDFQAPGPSTATTTFYAHVLDWRGDARPDMSYQLSVSGLVTPLQITGSLQFYGISQRAQAPIFLGATGGAGTYNWSVISGGLPPGMNLYYTGALSGTPTATGSYNFQVQVSDPGPPAQTAVAAMTMTIVPPLQFTATTTLPPGAVGVPYSAQIMVSGGVLPYKFSPTPSTWLVPAGLIMDPSSGIISGTPTSSGIYTATVQVTDSEQPSQTLIGTVTITVNP